MGARERLILGFDTTVISSKLDDQSPENVKRGWEVLIDIYASESGLAENINGVDDARLHILYANHPRASFHAA